MNDIRNLVNVKQIEGKVDYLELEKGTNFFFGRPDGISSALINCDNISFIAYLEYAAGKYRGGHYHKKKIEHMCITSGSLIGYYWIPSAPGDLLGLFLGKGSLVTIRPGAAHIYYSPDSLSSAVEFSPQRFELEDFYEVDAKGVLKTKWAGG